jgi:hypothetical protein
LDLGAPFEAGSKILPGGVPTQIEKKLATVGRLGGR